ncbi:uncharacterized protein [Garra rufa]|uniref:uncharacterized protein n=1 Tax=Garra rufa TaxID=137080 RepID=UPI003CCE8D66
MGEISEASLLDYIWSSGGKVKNSDLSKTYKHFINHSDLQLRAKYREEFKLIIDRIAVVKSENGEKYLVLKKKYRQQMQERESGAGKGGQPIKQVFPNSQNELQVSNPVQNCNPKAPEPAMVAWCSGPMITVTEAAEPTQTDNRPRLPTSLSTSLLQRPRLSTSLLRRSRLSLSLFTSLLQRPRLSRSLLRRPHLSTCPLRLYLLWRWRLRQNPLRRQLPLQNL